MNKLTKIGVSALCGSLASISAANAGSLEVLGGATATYSSNEGAVTGNPIGMNTGITFKGSGELDNGTTFTLTITQADQIAYSAGSIAMTTPSMGGIKINGKSGGTGVDRYDDMMPTAWEETNGTSLTTGLQTVAGVGTAMNIEWTASADMLPDGTHFGIAIAPGSATGATSNDKGVGGDSGGVGSGYDITVGYTGLMDGLNVFGGMSTIEQPNGDSGGSSTDGDRSQYVAGATYAVGAVTVGYQVSRDNLESSAAASTSFYDNTAYGVSFAVNDDLTLSYGMHKSDRNLTNNTSVELEAQSLQLSYSMGGMSIKFAESQVDNASYTSGTSADNDGRTIALTLAF